MEKGQLIVVDGQICEYDRYDKYLDVHYATEIEVDEYGHMTVTYAPLCFDPKEFTDGYNKANFTVEQWYGIVECLIRQGYDLDNEEIDDATADIVERCFAVNMPKFDELEDYIDRYMDR